MKLLSFILSLLIHIIFIALFMVIITEYNAVLKEKPKIYSVELVNYKIARKNEHKKISKHKKVKTKVPTKKQKPKLKKREKPKPPKQLKPEKKPKPAVVPKPPKKTKKRKQVKKPPKPPLKKEKPKKKPKKHTLPKKIKKKVTKKKIHKENPELKRIKEELYREKIATLRRKLEKERLASEIARIKKEIAEKKAEAKMRRKNLVKYSTLISNIIHSNWYVDTKLIKNKILITVVKVTLDSKGIITNISIMKSSGNFYFDKTVRDAVVSSEPFPRPPADLLTNGYVTFILKFDSRQL